MAREANKHDVNNQETTEIEVITSGSLLEVIAGAGAIALTILGLIHIGPRIVLPIAAIVVGGGLLVQGSAIAGEYSALLHQTSGADTGRTTFGGGISLEILGGLAGIGLGIAALVGLVPEILLPVAAITVGCTVAASSLTISRLNNLKVRHSGINEASQQVAGEAINAASGVQVLLGLGAIALGIIRLLGGGGAEAGPVMVLIQIAFLALGFAIFVTGLTISGRSLTGF